MSCNTRKMTIVAIISGIVTGSMLFLYEREQPNSAKAMNIEPVASDVNVAELKAEIERLKQLVPDQAHAMADVDYHFTNLWFSANQQNWELAQFYFNETRSHLRWAVRIIPVRKDNAGKEIKLEDILQALENNPLKQLEESIKSHDIAAFVAAYEFTITSCYSCHKASDKPYLRPRIPEKPASSMMNFNPHANWPL